jgi:YD repeat-containing protein
VTRPDTETRTYHYEDTGLPFTLTGVTDERGVRYSTFAYASDERAISTEHFGGTDLFTFDYDDANNKVTVTNPLGKDTDFEFAVSQSTRRLTEIVGQPSPNCPLSNSTLEYDANEFVSAIVDEEGRRTELTNDARGLPTEIVRAVGTADEQTTTVTWDSIYRLPTQIEAPGLTTDIDYNGDGNPTEVTQTDMTTVTVPYVTAGTTRVWAYTYTTGGLVETIDGPLAGTGDTIIYDYDADGFLEQVTNQLSQMTEILSVNDRGLPTEIEDPNGLEYDLGYDDIGRLTSFTEDAAGTPRVTDIDYDEVGEVTRITLPDGSFLDYVYSGARRLESVENNAGERIEYGYDDAGNMTNRMVKNAASSIVETQTRTFDELSRLLTLIGASSQTWTFSYDKVNNLVEVEDPRSNTFGGAYDALNRLIELTDEDDATTTLTRAETGEVATVEDPNVVVTTYVRNGWGEVIREQSQDIGTTDYVRNALGLVTQKTDPRGVVSNYTYDNLGRMTAATYPISAENVTYTYDQISGGNLGIGQLTSMTDESGSTAFTYDARPGVAKVTTTIAGKTYTVSYTYDPAGRILEIAYPDRRVVRYTYDASGRPTTIATADVFNGRPFVNLATGITTQPYDGTWTALSHANGVADSRVLDDDVRITSYTTEFGVTDIVSRTLAYGDGINLTGVTDNLNAANNETYSYTATNRLEDTTGPWGSLDFVTDGVGNRTSQVLTSGTTTTDVYALFTGTNRIQSVTTNGTPSRAFTYDAAGNILTDTKGGVTTTYTYNNTGRMASLTVGSVG